MKSRWVAKLLLLVLCYSHLQGTPQASLFKKYQNQHFVETGTFEGKGCLAAYEAGFRSIYSIEVHRPIYEETKKKLKENRTIHLYCGDSGKNLWRLIRNLREPITFWLDGHYSCGNTGFRGTKCPLLDELKQIQKHPIKTHTILIDDIRQCGNEKFDFPQLESIVEKLLEINPDYEIEFEDGFVPKDILVAHIKHK